MLLFLLHSGNCRRLQSKLQEFKSPFMGAGAFPALCYLGHIFLAPKLQMPHVFAKELSALS